MSHPFYKSASRVSGMPGRIAGSAWDKLKKYAHGVWEIQSDGSDPVIVRKRDESAHLNPNRSTQVAHEVLDNTDDINPGDLVLLFMGGHKLAARVASCSGDFLSVTTTEGNLDNIHKSWVRKADPGMPVAPPRTTTRDDIPAQDQGYQVGPSPHSDYIQSKLGKFFNARPEVSTVFVRVETGIEPVIFRIDRNGQGFIVRHVEMRQVLGQPQQYGSLQDLIYQFENSTHGQYMLNTDFSADDNVEFEHEE